MNVLTIRHFPLVMALVLGACSSTPTPPPPTQVAANPPAPRPAAPPAPTPMPATSRPAPTSTVATVTLPAHLDTRSAISNDRSVYFDFDDFSIKSEYSAMLERHGKYLASNKALLVKIEGNADERGSREYNLALGQKRAESVKRALKIYGASEQQMEAISWGEEKPVAAGHDEGAWAKNRRADIQYPNK